MAENFLEDDHNNLIDSNQYKKLKDSSVLVTGASGFIGSVLLKTLSEISLRELLNINLITLSRRPIKKEKKEFDFCVNRICEDVRIPINIPGDVDYIIHCASVTDSLTMKNNPVDTFLTSVEGTKNILELARDKKVKSMVFLSSMEVYGANALNPLSKNSSIPDGAAAHCVTEDMLGYMDLKNPRTSYPEGKRAAEFLCNAYYSEYGVPVKVARLAQTFGPGVSRTDNRVFSQFARSVMNGTDIVLHTDGNSEGNYCHIADTVSGILTVLLNGYSGEAYNVVNENLHMTIGQMAEFVVKEIAQEKIKVITQIPNDLSKYGYAPPTKLRLNSEKLKNLGWHPKFNMRDMYEHMIEYWKEQKG